MVADETENKVVNAYCSLRMPRSQGRVRGMLKNQLAVNTVTVNPAWLVVGPFHATARLRQSTATNGKRTRPHRHAKSTHGYPGSRSLSYGGVVVGRKRGALAAINFFIPRG